MFYIGCTAIAKETTDTWKKGDRFEVFGVKNGSCCMKKTLLLLHIKGESTCCFVCENIGDGEWYFSECFTIEEEDVNIEELTNILKEPIKTLEFV